MPLDLEAIQRRWRGITATKMRTFEHKYKPITSALAELAPSDIRELCAEDESTRAILAEREAKLVTLTAENARLRAERDWLRGRAAQAGCCWLTEDREWGISSNAMVEYGLGGPMPLKRQYPLDSSDLQACVLTHRSAPEHLRGRMDEVLMLYRAALEDKPCS